jgi:DcuC family C4-dicarboxylate transporter
MPPAISLPLALVTIAGAVYLVLRRVEVRLVLLGAGLAMCLLAGQPLALTDAFTRGMVTEMVAPICAAMGFAAVLAATGCDRHLVYYLLAPARAVPFLVVPAGILGAYLLNLAIPSQTSTAAAIGPVLVPLLLAGGMAPEVAGAALVLGASFGGDLLNPASQDVQTVAGLALLRPGAITARVVPAGIAGAFAAAAAFTLLNRKRAAPQPAVDASPASPEAGFYPSPLKALIPLIPVVLLLAAYSGWPPAAWLLPPKGTPLENALPVVRAMLIGVAAAALVSRRELAAVTTVLFDGMGSAYGRIISLTICAACFGAGIKAAGVADALLALVGAVPWAMRAMSAALPWSLAALSGSGSAPVQTFASSFLAGADPAADRELLGALACLGGAFGRTMSPVAAVVIYSSGLVGRSPIELVRRHLPALLIGAAVALAVVLVRG